MVSGDTLDIKGNTLLVGNYQGDKALQLFDLGMLKEKEFVPWLKSDTGKKGNCHIYTAQFANNEDAIVAGSWKSNDLRLYERNQEGKEIIIHEVEDISWGLASRI